MSLVSPEYAARPVQPLNPQSALAEINAYRAQNGRGPLVLDERLSRAAAMQAEDQAGRGSIGHYGSDGSKPKDRAARAGFQAKIASENVASGQKSFSDAMYYWERSSGHRENLLRANVSAAGMGMAQAEAAAPIGARARRRVVAEPVAEATLADETRQGGSPDFLLVCPGMVTSRG